MSLDLRFERLIAAAPERVFDAFTDPVGQREFYGQEFTFEPRGRSTLMTMVQAGFPSEGLRDEHTVGLPNAFDRLDRALDDPERS